MNLINLIQKSKKNIKGLLKQKDKQKRKFEFFTDKIKIKNEKIKNRIIK